MKIDLMWLKKYGFSFFPTEQNKSPYTKLLPNGKWGDFQKRLPNIGEIKNWNKNAIYIAVICGAISKNLECIDIDNHAGNAKEVLDKFKGLVDTQDPELWSSLVIEQSQSGGYHLFYRCESEIEGSQKLASQILNGKKDTFIETKGEGGYVVVSPSPGYDLLQGTFDNLPILKNENRALLLEIARSFNQVVEKEKEKIFQFPTITEADGTIRPRLGDMFNSLGKHRELLEGAGWTLVYTDAQQREGWRRPGKDKGISATYNAVPERFYVFTTNAERLEPYKAYDDFALYTFLNCSGDFKEAVKRIQKDYPLLSNIHNNGKTNGVAKHSKDFQQSKDKTTDLKDRVVFWNETIDSSKRPKLTIDKSKIIEFLEYFHFGKIWLDTNVSQLVRVQDNKVSEETPETIVDFIKSSILCLDTQMTTNFTKYDVWEACLNIIDKIKSPKFLETLQIFNLDLIKDTKDKSFFFFKNCVVEVSANEIKTKSYAEFDKKIWKNQIIKRNFAKIDPDPDNELNPFNSDFCQFLMNVCSVRNQIDPDNRKARILDTQRFTALKTAIGYLMHTYQNPTLTKAIIFCEEKISIDDNANGRTGKGLTAKAISMLRRRVLYNSKSIDFKNRFIYQNISPDTQLIYFDDVRKNFDFEALFTLLTDGFSIEYKNKKPIDVPFENVPKVLISTNAILPNDDDSHKDRKFEIEFSDYYSADWKPENDFEKPFFGSEWNEDEWNAFFNFMMSCEQLYLQIGLTEYQPVNLIERKLKALMPQEFQDYADGIYEDKLEKGEKVYTDDLYEKFIEKHKDLVKNSNMTTKWFNQYLKTKKIEFLSKPETKRNDRRRYWILLKYIQNEDKNNEINWLNEEIEEKEEIGVPF